MKGFVIDVAKCNGCYNCQIACKDEHCGADWSPYAKPQPETGQFWLRINEKTRGQVPVVRLSYIPILCAHCKNAPCIAEAEAFGKPEAVYRREDGLIILDPAFSGDASLAAALVESCPLDAIYFNEALGLAQKCTGCAHLLDNGWKEPRCCDVCPTGALRYEDVSGLEGLLVQAETLEVLKEFQPNSYNLNLPKRFVAVTAVDFLADEVIIGATVTLRDSVGEVVKELKTDDFGDVLFNQVPAKRYQVIVAMPGYTTVTREVDAREKDIVLGPLGLEKV
jgi:Fe-S-cluster-containing dehydrogenase component